MILEPFLAPVRRGVVKAIPGATVELREGILRDRDGRPVFDLRRENMVALRVSRDAVAGIVPVPLSAFTGKPADVASVVELAVAGFNAAALIPE